MRQVPILSNALPTSAERALRAERGDILLAYCGSCGMIHNTAFDPELLYYTADYETSLHFSPHFQEYARDLARRLIKDHSLEGADIVEIGCGKGDFLTLLHDDGRNRCIGFDASYDDNQGRSAGDLRIIKAFYSSSEHSDVKANLLACRHVLEHIDDPGGFLAGLKPALKSTGSVYFEVPDAMFTLRDFGIWDIIYEHCSYFTAPSIDYLFRSQGLIPSRICSGFGGQFLCVDAESGDAGPPASAARSANLAELGELVSAFSTSFRDKVASLNQLVGERLERGVNLAVWGAGSKGVTFLNLVEGGADIHTVVDVNERKRGRFVPGTGQAIIAPEELARLDVGTVLVMNPNYREEIQQHLSRIGISPEVLVV